MMRMIVSLTGLRLLGRTPLLRKSEQGPEDEVLAIPITFSPPQPKVVVASLMLVADDPFVPVRRRADGRGVAGGQLESS